MWMLLLLLLPFIGLLWVPFYNFQEPALFGFPFFYWYQLAWVPISSLLIWLVYRKRAPDQEPGDPGAELPSAETPFVEMFIDRAGFPARGEKSHHGDEEKEKEKDPESRPVDLIGHLYCL